MLTSIRYYVLVAMKLDRSNKLAGALLGIIDDMSLPLFAAKRDEQQHRQSFLLQIHTSNCCWCCWYVGWILLTATTTVTSGETVAIPQHETKQKQRFFPSRSWSSWVMVGPHWVVMPTVSCVYYVAITTTLTDCLCPIGESRAYYYVIGDSTSVA